MAPIEMAPGIIVGLVLLWVARLQRRYAATIDSDAFLLSRRRVALGIRRLAGIILALAIVVASAPIVLHIDTQRAHQQAAMQLTMTIDGLQQQIEELDRQLVEAKLRLEQADRLLSAANHHSFEAAAVPASARSMETHTPGPASDITAAYVHKQDATHVNLRSVPAGRIIGSLKDGDPLTVDARQVTFADGHLWIKVRTSDGLSGWVIKEAVSNEPP